MTTIEGEHLLENVERRSAQIREGLELLASRAGFAKEVCGEGLMLAMELEVEFLTKMKRVLARKPRRGAARKPKAVPAGAQGEGLQG